MFLISHRGNLTGPNTGKGKENSLASIVEAVIQGFYVEVDVRLHEGELWAGHDSPDWNVENTLKNTDFFRKVFLHAKDVGALNRINDLYATRCMDFFFHQNDDATLTHKSLVWTYPNRNLPLSRRSILVMQDEIFSGLNIAGVCTDDPVGVRRKYLEGMEFASDL